LIEILSYHYNNQANVKRGRRVGRRAIIVGGGVTGLSTAYHLQRLGYGEVVILEKDTIGAGSSSRAAGISTGLLWSRTGILARKLALRRFREMSGELDGYMFHNEHGCLGLFSPALWPARAALLPLYDEYDVPYQVLSAREIRRRWPQLNPPDDHLGVLDPLGGYSEPDDYLAALRAKLRALGVDIREHTTVHELVISGTRVTGVRLDSGVETADAVVVANYAWVLPLLATAGLAIPAKTFVHQRYVSAPLATPFVAPPVNADPYLGYVRPAAGGRILIGAETPDRDDCKVDAFGFRLEALSDGPEVLPDVVERFRDFVPLLRDAEWETRKVGLISFSMDGEPILGPFGGMEGLFVGVCFHSGGFSYNPAAGYFLAEFVAAGKTSLDLAAFSPDRFGAAETADYLASTVPQRNAARRRH
jgi:sarcosine oxidase subunit beta